MNAVTINQSKFQAALQAAYVDLFASDPEYAYSAAQITPKALAAKMTAGLQTGAANHNGKGIKRACKMVGIKPTATAIRAYLSDAPPDRTCRTDTAFDGVCRNEYCLRHGAL